MRVLTKKAFLLVLFLFFAGIMVVAQEDDGDDSGDDIDDSSSTLSLERRIVEETNLARTKPAEYALKVKKYLSYIRGGLLRVPGQIAIRTREGASAYREAIRYLKRVSPVGRLEFSPGISRACRDHCKDQGRTGRTGHYGSDGSSPFQRMRRYGRYHKTAGENISYGPASAERIVVQLIVDDGVPSRGHRKNIFNPAFRVAGVGVGTHPVYRRMCVIGYAGGFTAK